MIGDAMKAMKAAKPNTYLIGAGAHSEGGWSPPTLLTELAGPLGAIGVSVEIGTWCVEGVGYFTGCDDGTDPDAAMDLCAEVARIVWQIVEEGAP